MTLPIICSANKLLQIDQRITARWQFLSDLTARATVLPASLKNQIALFAEDKKLESIKSIGNPTRNDVTTLCEMAITHGGAAILDSV